jgi:hypothetical protein
MATETVTAASQSENTLARRLKGCAVLSRDEIGIALAVRELPDDSSALPVLAKELADSLLQGYEPVLQDEVEERRRMNELVASAGSI